MEHGALIKKYIYFTFHVLIRISQDPEDLPFVKDELMVILRRDEEQWWTAQNERGQVGQVPVPYLEKVSLCTWILKLFWGLLKT